MKEDRDVVDAGWIGPGRKRLKEQQQQNDIMGHPP